MAATTKHEILAGAAVKRFLELLEDASRCQCGNSCETRMFLNRQLKSRDARANQIFADLFDEVLWLPSCASYEGSDLDAGFI